MSTIVSMLKVVYIPTATLCLQQGGEISQCSPGVYPGNLQHQKSYRLSSLPYNGDILYTIPSGYLVLREHAEKKELYAGKRNFVIRLIPGQANQLRRLLTLRA